MPSLVEGRLVEVLAEVLGIGRVSVESNFFDDLGADSMVMTRFCATRAEAARPADVHHQGRLPVPDHQGTGGGVRPSPRRGPGPARRRPPRSRPSLRRRPRPRPATSTRRPCRSPPPAPVAPAPAAPVAAAEPAPPAATMAAPVGTLRYLLCGTLQLLFLLGYPTLVGFAFGRVATSGCSPPPARSRSTCGRCRSVARCSSARACCRSWPSGCSSVAGSPSSSRSGACATSASGWSRR